LRDRKEKMRNVRRKGWKMKGLRRRDKRLWQESMID
jgi:hypothetical protein